MKPRAVIILVIIFQVVLLLNTETLIMQFFGVFCIGVNVGFLIATFLK